MVLLEALFLTPDLVGLGVRTFMYVKQYNRF
jgi:hypothetical protein